MRGRPMIHIAIMKKEWGFLEKILTGQKTIESRWYKNKYKPWDAIKKGDAVYFKNSGEPVLIKTQVKKIMQFSDLSPKKGKEILNAYGKDIGIEKNDIAEFSRKFRDKKYGILIFLAKAQKIKPFQIDKKGFGAMASWITVNNIHEIQQISQG